MLFREDTLIFQPFRRPPDWVRATQHSQNLQRLDHRQPSSSIKTGPTLEDFFQIKGGQRLTTSKHSCTDSPIETKDQSGDKDKTFRATTVAAGVTKEGIFSGPAVDKNRMARLISVPTNFKAIAHNAIQINSSKHSSGQNTLAASSNEDHESSTVLKSNNNIRDHDELLSINEQPDIPNVLLTQREKKVRGNNVPTPLSLLHFLCFISTCLF